MDNHIDPQAQRQAGAVRPRAALAAAVLFSVLLGLSLMLLAFGLGAYLGLTGRAPLTVDAQASGLVLAISVATSVVSLVGLLSTNLLAWRREAREARSAEVQLQRQQLEIEKLKLELERQKREG